jgi:hypothetical protein
MPGGLKAGSAKVERETRTKSRPQPHPAFSTVPG